MKDSRSRVIFGLGNSIDLESVWDDGIFCSLVKKYGITANEISTQTSISSLESERDVVVNILSFMQQGIGGEMYVSDNAIINQYASRFSCTRTLGGTGVRAANAAFKRGLRPSLHLVTQSDEMQQLLPSDCSYLCSSTSNSYSPHLIVQFAKGQKVSVNDINIIAPQSNRVILVHDVQNTELKLHVLLGDWLEDAELFLISGFNAMRNELLLRTRLDTLGDMVKHIAKDATVFYEDACYHQPLFSSIVNTAITPYVDIFSMNEDELEQYIGMKINLLNANEVFEALKRIKELICVPFLVVHTRHWALAVGHDAKRLAPALRGGIAMATTRYRLGDCFSENEYQETCRMLPEQSGVKFCDELTQIARDIVWCEPSLQVTALTPTTIGLGDAFVGGFFVEYISNCKKV